MKKREACTGAARKTILVALAGLMAVTVSAVPKTYRQTGARDLPNIVMAGISSGTEITSTPQLAFPGVTLEEIHQRQFITELHGGGVDTRATAWGIYPLRHYTDGKIDKLALQFGVNDNGCTKCVIFELTDGADGVYATRFSGCHKYGSCIRYQFYLMDGEGNISFRTDGDKPDGYNNGYKAWGIRISGVSVAPTACLALPGATLYDLVDADFLAGYQVGNGLDNPINDNMATHITYWPSRENIEKIVMQFTHPSDSQKTSIIQLTQGADGVCASQAWAAYNGTSGAKKYVIDEKGEISLPEGTSGWKASGNGGYSVWEFLAIPRIDFVPVSEQKLLFTKKGGVLTLNDLSGASFTARMGGGSVNSGSARNLLGQNIAVGYNTRESRDADGDINKIVTEFQYNDNGTVKAVIVEFTNGEDGVCAKAIGARHGLSFGYVFSDANGKYYGDEGVVVVENSAEGYGVFDVKVVADTAKIYRQGPSYTFAVVDTASPTSSTMFPTDAVVGFSGVKLEDLTQCVFLSYMQSGSIPGRYLLGKHATLNSDKTKLAVQFTADDGGCKKSAFVQLAYNDKSAITIQKVRNTWTNKGNAETKFFNDNFFVDPAAQETYTDQDANINHNNSQYHLYGFRILPGFVQTSPMLLFKGGDLDELENATFTARVGGPTITPLGDRVLGHNTRVIKDAQGHVTHILVEFQSSTDWIKATIVELTNGEDGVYAVAKEARYIEVSKGLGYQFVKSYDGSSIEYDGNDSSPASSPISGGYGVYDVQAAVEPNANEWPLEKDSSLSDYTDGESFDESDAIVRVKAKTTSSTLTIDRLFNAGKMVFENASDDDETVKVTLAIGTGVTANIAAFEVGKGVRLVLPVSLGSADVTVGKGGTVAYTGDGTVSGKVTGVGGVEVESGRVEFTGANDFSGGLVVKSGAVAVAGASVAQGATAGSFGAINASAPCKVTVESGGMVDVNGKDGLAYIFALAGDGFASDTEDVPAPGPIVNQGSPLTLGWLTKKEWTVGQARGYNLLSDVEIGRTGQDLGIATESVWENPSHKCTLDLGEHTLTKVGVGTLWLWSKEFGVIGTGKLQVNEGVVDIRQGPYNGDSSTVEIGEEGTLRIGAEVKAAAIVNNGRIEVTSHIMKCTVKLSGEYSGDGLLSVLPDGTLTIGEDLTVADFVNNGKVVGDGVLTVTGTFTTGQSVSNLTLAAGATVKIADAAAVQTVTGAFAALGTVTVDVSTITEEESKAAGKIPLLSTTSEPSGRWTLNDPYTGRCLRWNRVNGGWELCLKEQKGFTVILR